MKLFLYKGFKKLLTIANAIWNVKIAERTQWMIAVFVSLMLVNSGVNAADAGDGLCIFIDTFTGRPMFAGAFIAVVVGVLGYFFGGEMNDLMKTIFKIILGVGVVFGFAAILTKIFALYGKASAACAA